VEQGAAEQIVLARHVRLDLSRLTPGRYIVELDAVSPSKERVTARRQIEILQGPGLSS
jgi:hypothetical protein